MRNIEHVLVTDIPNVYSVFFELTHYSFKLEKQNTHYSSHEERQLGALMGLHYLNEGQNSQYHRSHIYVEMR